MKRLDQERPLSSWLVFLLATTALVTMTVGGSIVLALRIKHIERTSLQVMERAASDVASRVEGLLGALQARLEAYADMLQVRPVQQLREQAAEILLTDALLAVYVTDARGRVTAVQTVSSIAAKAEQFVGADLAHNPLYISMQRGARTTWSDKYLSPISGAATVAVGVPLQAGGAVVAELDPAYLLRTTLLAQTREDYSVWVIDRRGEVVVDTASQLVAGVDNIGELPPIRALLQGEPQPARMQFRDTDYMLDIAHSHQLGWIFLIKTPRGLDNPEVRAALFELSLLCVSGIVIGLLLTPLWSRGLGSTVGSLMQRARQVADGAPSGEWPRGRVTEFNRLAGDLERMAHAIAERERKFLAIFNASPVAMLVSSASEASRVIEVNKAWERQFGIAREQAVGQPEAELGLWPDAAVRATTYAALEGEASRTEANLLGAGGRRIDCSVSLREAALGGDSLRIVVMEDVTDRRLMERELIELNHRLEARVTHRTEALQLANRDLSAALDQLKSAQDELVRTEKLASLGELVAGIAHELNTPLGNGLMAVSTLAGQTSEFRKHMQGGLRRSMLEQFVENVGTGIEIATRNIGRAGELVASFKQVAVDQASSQRRVFDLADMINEVLLTLRPALRRTPYLVKNEVPAGIRLDSYPGPLGQVLTNLVNNAVMHGFDGREHGTVSLIASTEEISGATWVTLTVHDDGRGIPSHLLQRVFDPFVTTRKGRGGTGLGLHIVHNMMTQLLGGVVALESWEDVGTIFSLHFPANAPAPVVVTPGV